MPHKIRLPLFLTLALIEVSTSLIALPAFAVDSCQKTSEKFVFPVDAKNPFFPRSDEIYCKTLANGLVVNLPLREKNGVLIYAIGGAPLKTLNEYLAARGTSESAKASAIDPAMGTVRIAFYDMLTSVGHFHSLAVTIVTESGNLPAAFHYARYYAAESYNVEYGKYHIGVDKTLIPIRSNLRNVLKFGKASAAQRVYVVSSNGKPGGKVFELDITIPENLKYTHVPGLDYKTSSEGAAGGTGSQFVIGKIRGDFSASISTEGTRFSISTDGDLKEMLTALEFQLTSFQIVKNFDLVERDFIK